MSRWDESDIIDEINYPIILNFTEQCPNLLLRLRAPIKTMDDKKVLICTPLDIHHDGKGLFSNDSKKLDAEIRLIAENKNCLIHLPIGTVSHYRNFILLTTPHFDNSKDMAGANKLFQPLSELMIKIDQQESTLQAYKATFEQLTASIKEVQSGELTDINLKNIKNILETFKNTGNTGNPSGDRPTQPRPAGGYPQMR